MYIYPDNLKSKATLWLWELRDIGIIGVGCLISVFALSRLGWLPPIVLTAVYAFLSIPQWHWPAGAAAWRRQSPARRPGG